MKIVRNAALGIALLGMVGLGHRSPYAPSFRAIARALATFLLVRLQPRSPNKWDRTYSPMLVPTALLLFDAEGQKLVASLEALVNKTRGDPKLAEAIRDAAAGVRDASLTLMYATDFLRRCLRSLAPEFAWLLPQAQVH